MVIHYVEALYQVYAPLPYLYLTYSVRGHYVVDFFVIVTNIQRVFVFSVDSRVICSSCLRTDVEIYCTLLLVVFI